jgi:hypothetical protein
MDKRALTILAIILLVIAMMLVALPAEAQVVWPTLPAPICGDCEKLYLAMVIK